MHGLQFLYSVCQMRYRLCAHVWDRQDGNPNAVGTVGHLNQTTACNVDAVYDLAPFLNKTGKIVSLGRVVVEIWKLMPLVHQDVKIKIQIHQRAYIQERHNEYDAIKSRKATSPNITNRRKKNANNSLKKILNNLVAINPKIIIFKWLEAITTDSFNISRVATDSKSFTVDDES